MDRKKAMTMCRSVRVKTRWAMDFDYLSTLELTDLEFLADFCNLHYHGSPHKVGIIEVTTELRKESYRRNNKAEFDIYTKMQREHIDFADSQTNFNHEDYIIEYIDKKYI